MDKRKWNVCTRLTSDEKDSINLLNQCPQCEGPTVTETSGPLTDWELCEDCALAWHPEEAR